MAQLVIQPQLRKKISRLAELPLRRASGQDDVARGVYHTGEFPHIVFVIECQKVQKGEFLPRLNETQPIELLSLAPPAYRVDTVRLH